ncbi:MAG: radical SAM protein, partial [Gammaproteobacteria bacterium]|nr:radical SAM protein [Gammaproteobacteria bacterium]
EPDFTFGTRLADSLGEVSLNHPHCARFCVLGGGSCSG